MFTNVLVGVDREDHGQDATALASRLLEAGGQLTLAHLPRSWLFSAPRSIS